VKTLEVILSDEDAAKVEGVVQRRGIPVHQFLAQCVAERLEREAALELAAGWIAAQDAALHERLSRAGAGRKPRK
jgi:hypothetical protein